MGWINGPIDGVPTIWHNGSTGNFYWELLLPALLLGLPLLNGYLTWRGLFFNAPDLVSWLLVILALLLITGITRLVLIVRVLRRGESVDRPAVTPAPATNMA